MSSSSPRCLRSLISAAIGRSIGLALVRQAVADVLAGTCAVEIPSPVEKLHESHAPSRPVAGLEGDCWPGCSPPAEPHRHPASRFGSREMSITSGTEVCMRKASSYCEIRVSVSGWPSCSGLELVQIVEGVERHAADLAVHAGRVGNIEHRIALASGTARPGKRSAGSRSRTSSCRRWAACRWRSAR